jgi:hypothetical protein
MTVDVLGDEPILKAPIDQSPGIFSKIGSAIGGAGKLIGENAADLTYAVLSPVDAALRIGAGVAAWPVGVIAGAGSGIGARLAGQSPEESAKAFESAQAKYGGMVQNFLSPKLPNKYGLQAAGLAGEGIDLALSGPLQLANMKGDLYKEAGLKPVSETHPLLAKYLSTMVELMAFKAAHTTGAKAKAKWDAWRIKAEELKNKAGIDLTEEDINTINKFKNEAKRAKRLGQGPKVLLKTPKDYVDEEFFDHKGHLLPEPEQVPSVESSLPTTWVRRPVIPDAEYYDNTGRLAPQGQLEGRRKASEQKALPAPQKALEAPYVEKFNRGEAKPLEQKQSVERKPARLGNKDITPEDLQAKPETVIERIDAILPDVKKYIDSGEGDPIAIKERLNNTLSGLDPAEGRAMVDTVEGLMGEINKRIKRGGLEDANKTRARVAEESKRISQEEKTSSPQGGVTGEGEGQVRLRDTTQDRVEAQPVAKFNRESTGKYLSDDGKIRIVKKGKTRSVTDADSGVPVAEGFKTLKEAKKDAGGALSDMTQMEKDLQVTEGPKLSGVDLIRQRVERLKSKGILKTAPEFEAKLGSLEDRLRAQKVLEDDINEALESERNKKEIEDILASGDELPPDEYTTSLEDMHEYQTEAMKGSVDYEPGMADYGVGKFARDFFDVLLDERGSFSTNKLGPEDIARIDRMYRKAKEMGRDLGEMLKEMGLDPATIKNINDFIKEHFAPGEIETKTRQKAHARKAKEAAYEPWFPKPQDVINKVKSRLHKGQTITYPEYNYSMLQAMMEKPDLTNRLGTTARKFRPAASTFDSLPRMKEELHRPYHAAEKQKFVEVKWYRDRLRELHKGMSKDNKLRILRKLVGEQENGSRLLKESGIDDRIPTLNAKEQAVADFFEEEFNMLHSRANGVRTKIGRNPVEKLPHYFTFMRSFGLLEKFGLKGGGIFDRAAKVIENDAAVMKDAPFKYRHRRLKNALYTIEKDPFKIFDKYMSAAEHYIHISPVVAKARTMLKPVKNPTTGKMFNPKFERPNTYTFVKDWAHKISGKAMPNDLSPAWRKITNGLNQNLASSILGYNIRSFLIQPQAFVNTVTHLGLRYALKGAMTFVKPSAHKMAMLKSDVLGPRNLNIDVAFDEMLGPLKDIKVKDFHTAYKKFKRGSMIPLQFLDMLTAEASWHGAYLKAKGELGLGERGAINYADDVVVRTQASGMPGDIAPVQYTALGKTATMFQTFVINNWDFLTREVIGIGSDTTVGQALPKIAKYVIATAIVNYLYEDLGPTLGAPGLSIKSPSPRPVKAFMDALDKNKNAVDTAIDIGKELIEPIPVIGNARYGKGPLGPAAEKVTELFTGGKYGMTPAKEIQLMQQKGRVPDKTLESIGSFTGVPGTTQVMKTLRGLKRGETPIGAALGTYTPKASGASRGRRLGRGSRGGTKSVR